MNHLGQFHSRQDRPQHSSKQATPIQATVGEEEASPILQNLCSTYVGSTLQTYPRQQKKTVA